MKAYLTFCLKVYLQAFFLQSLTQVPEDEAAEECHLQAHTQPWKSAQDDPKLARSLLMQDDDAGFAYILTGGFAAANNTGVKRQLAERRWKHQWREQQVHHSRAAAAAWFAWRAKIFVNV